MRYISLNFYRDVFACDDPEDIPDALLEEYITAAECEVETFAAAGGYAIPLPAKQALFLRSCILDTARYQWANNAAQCTDDMRTRYKECQDRLKDVKSGECPLPPADAQAEAVNIGGMAVVELCRA